MSANSRSDTLMRSDDFSQLYIKALNLDQHKLVTCCCSGDP